jgi:hypothetical protein
MISFLDSKAQYDTWMQGQLGSDFVAADLDEKNSLMRDSAFVFLRGTYWRWAETILEVCPDLATAPDVLAVGDIHLENFGTWRDVDGRLVWGVNDFDEAAMMPYTIDLVRLATSAILGGDDRKGALDTITSAILRGYGEGLAAPSPIVLDRDWASLRADVVVPEDRRDKFWKKIDARDNAPAPPRFQKALAAAMPEPGVGFDTARRVAGTGSLGRPRWIGVATWRGGPIVREAKALLTSGWLLARGHAEAPIRAGDIAAGRYRAPDPWYDVADGIVVRRISPNNRKIEADKRGAFLLEPETHEAMGFELANIHLGTGEASDAILADLRGRKPGWLAANVEAAAAAVRADYKQFKKR